MVYVTLTVGPKGQVVIPHRYRKKHHIEPGDLVLMEDKDDELVLKPSKPYGFLKFIEKMPKIDLGEFDPHEAYEDQMRHREKKRQKLFAWNKT